MKEKIETRIRDLIVLRARASTAIGEHERNLAKAKAEVISINGGILELNQLKESLGIEEIEEVKTEEE